MIKPIVKIHNTQTNEVIDREMTDEEYAEFLIVQARIDVEVAERQAEAEAKAAQKAALLNRLGITEEEAKLLLA